MQLLFQELGFFVREYVNLTVNKMRSVFRGEASANYSLSSAFVVCILTRRGETEETFQCTDSIMKMEELVKIIGDSNTLRDIPKLLILHFAAGKFLLSVFVNISDNFKDLTLEFKL